MGYIVETCLNHLEESASQMKRTIVIIGGVAGGASAAARLRRLNENDHIIMFERGEHISFANCGLPYHIGETIPNRGKLLIQTPQGMNDRFRIDVRTKTEVVRIDRERKQVIVRRTDTGEESSQTYDYVVLSPGAKPIMPSIDGIEDADNIYTLRNMADMDRIKQAVDNGQSKHATIVGGGFIGIEMAENLRERGLEVTIVERNDQLLKPFDVEMARIIEQHAAMKGVQLRFNALITRIADRGRTIAFEDGESLRTDLIIMAIGVTPESDLAKEAGLALGVRGSIKVNAHLQTSDPSIYAVGDAIEVKDRVQGFETTVPLAWGANRQGRLVADHIHGRAAEYAGAYGTAIVKVFDLTAAVTGNNERTLQQLGIPFETLHIHPLSHAGYYPGAASLALKLLFDKTTGTIFGAQAVGADGVDKRIDVIATAMRGGLLASELADLELSYAPPFSSAKDPVNMAGYVAGNMMDGLTKTMQWHEVNAFVESGGLLVDVRDAIERDLGYIPGSVNIPLNELRDRLQELPKDRELAVSCQVGLRGYYALRLLSEHGYDVRNVDGGYKTYSAVYGNSNKLAVNQPVSQPVTDAPSPAQTAMPTLLVDACGLQCPGPIVKVYEAMNGMNEGGRLVVKATDLGFAPDIVKWAEKTGNTVESVDTGGGIVSAILRKGNMNPAAAAATVPAQEKNGATMVVFSGDLDKTIAAFIIATGAAAMGKKVTMFFTFWGLNVLRRPDAPKVNKSAMESMLGMMMPKGSASLPLSKMNMAGIGPKMIRRVMDNKNVQSLESLMEGAVRAGVNLIACTMSMDIMGVKREELIEGIDYAGVASYLGDAEDAGLNLFI